MIGKVGFTCTTYAQFCRRVRKIFPAATKESLYREWCRELDSTVNGIHYERIAKRIEKRQSK